MRLEFSDGQWTLISVDNPDQYYSVPSEFPTTWHTLVGGSPPPPTGTYIGSVIINVDTVGGSGTFNSWTITLAGNVGATGPTGYTGYTGPTGPADSINGSTFFTLTSSDAQVYNIHLVTTEGTTTLIVDQTPLS